MQPSDQKKEPSAWKADPDIYKYGASPMRPSPQQRRWAGLPVAIILVIIVLALLAWFLLFRG